ncbi:hypothetical protein B0H10DRAFT_2203221, partial [Mycena sp. CBHHK59/15]
MSVFQGVREIQPSQTTSQWLSMAAMMLLPMDSSPLALFSKYEHPKTDDFPFGPAIEASTLHKYVAASGNDIHHSYVSQ